MSFPAFPNVADLQHAEVLDWLPWLAALAALHLASFLQQWWWQRRQFAAPVLRRFGPGLSLGRGFLHLGLWAAAGWQLLLALAVPLGPPVKIAGKQYGADVVLCVDVSASMLAQDVAPDRLDAVKQALDGLLDSGSLDGDRVGLVAFAGGAVVACPLTTDYDTARLFLDKLDGDCVPRDGTDLSSAIAMALDGFGQDSTRGRLIVLATDGEDTLNSDVLAEAQRARRAGVAVECVGVGTPEGAYIPGQRDVFGRVYAKLWHGQPVRTRMDRAALERIAAASGGEYLSGSSAAALARMAAKVAHLRKGLGKAPDRYVRDPLYEVPLLWALALLLADSLLSLRGRGWLRVGEKTARLFSRHWFSRRVLPLLCLLALSATARADLDNGRSAYNEGNEAYRNGDYGAAADDYRQAAATGSLKEAAEYNLGSALFQEKDYQGAADAYAEALKLNPYDPDAQYNQDLAQKMADQQQKMDGKNGKGDSKSGKGGKGKGNGNGTGNGQGQAGQGGQNGQPPPPPGSPLPKGGRFGLRKGSGGQKPEGGGNQQGGGGQQQGGGNQQGSGGNQQADGGNQPANGGSRQEGVVPSAPPGPRLSRDQIEAMLNRLRQDQRKYEGAFNPLRHYGNQNPQPEDPAKQFLEQFGGLPSSQKTPTPESDPDYKDW